MPNYTKDNSPFIDDGQERELTPRENKRMNIFRKAQAWQAVCWPILICVGAIMEIIIVDVLGKEESGTSVIAYWIGVAIMILGVMAFIGVITSALLYCKCTAVFCACTKSSQRELEHVWRDEHLKVRKTAPKHNSVIRQQPKKSY